MKHPNIKAISFTRSTRVSREIAKVDALESNQGQNLNKQKIKDNTDPNQLVLPLI